MRRALHQPGGTDSGAQHNVIAELAREFNTHVVFGMVGKEKVEASSTTRRSSSGRTARCWPSTARSTPRRERLAFRPAIATSSPRLIWVGGLMLGWDLAFPEVARSLALDGAELLCVAANWENPNAEEWTTYNLARARENSIFMVSANRIGEEYTYTFCGHSMVVGPRGGVHAVVEDDQTEGYCLVKIDLDEVRKTREESQLFQCRQPQSYRTVVRKY